MFNGVSDGLILAMKDVYFPMTKMIYVLMGRIDPGAPGIACALGVIGMLLLTTSLLVAADLVRGPAPNDTSLMRGARAWKGQRRRRGCGDAEEVATGGLGHAAKSSRGSTSASTPLIQK